MHFKKEKSLPIFENNKELVKNCLKTLKSNDLLFYLFLDEEVMAFSNQRKKDIILSFNTDQISNENIYTILNLKEAEANKRRKNILKLTNYYSLDLAIQDKKSSSALEHEILSLVEKNSYCEISSLTKIRIAILNRNFAWARRVLKIFFNRDDHRLNFCNLYDFKTLQRAYILVLALIEKNSKNFDELALPIFKQKKSFFESNSDYELVWSLSEMRTFYKQYRYRGKYWKTWYDLLESRAPTKEVQIFLDQNFNYQSLKLKQFDDLWFLLYYLPPDDKRRSVITEILLKNNGKNNDYQIDLLIRLSESHVLKKIIEETHKEFLMPIFKIKRKYYKQMIKQGTLSNMALYNLIEIGDLNTDYLWWVLFNSEV